MVLPVFWREYTDMVRGNVDRIVQCEECHAEYHYLLVRVEAGRGSSLYMLDNAGASQRASTQAEERLQRALAIGVDPVPCPECGHFQATMVREARSAQLRWINSVALWGLLSAPMWLFGLIIINGVIDRGGPLIIWEVFYPLLIVPVVSLLLLPVVRLILVMQYDPNNDSPEVRVRRLYLPGTLLKDSAGNPAPVVPEASVTADMAARSCEAICCEQCRLEYRARPTDLLAVIETWPNLPLAPCPRCGHIQRAMFPAARARLRKGIELNPYVLLPALGFMTVAISVQTSREVGDEVVGGLTKRVWCWLIEAAFVLAPCAWMLFRWYRANNRDPNRLSLKQRLQWAAEFSQVVQPFTSTAAQAWDMVESQGEDAKRWDEAGGTD